MKKYACLFLCLLWASVPLIHAQTCSFPKRWESKFDNDADYWRFTSSNGKFCIGTTKKDACVLDGATGKTLWCKSFMDIAGVKDAASQEYIEDAERLLLIAKKKGNDEIFCLDVTTGNKIWSNTNYNGINLSDLIYIPNIKSFVVVLDKGLVFIDSETGKEQGSIDGLKGVIGRWSYLPSTKQIVLLTYQVNAFKAIGSGFKNQLICIDAASKKVEWQSEFKGVVEIKRYASLSFSVFDWVAIGAEKGIGSSNVLVDFYIKNDRIYLVFNGLKVYDLNNGQKVWDIDFDLSVNRGLGGSTQMYNAVAEPLITENFVYLVSFESGRDKSIKKLDIATGKTIWEAPVDGRKVIIPNLVLIDGVLVAQFGGYVNLQGELNTSNGTTYFNKWEWKGPFGLKGFDDATGKMLWETEKFDDRITNIVTTENKLAVADKADFYLIDPKSGQTNAINFKANKIGEANYVFKNGSDLVLMGEKGFNVYQANGNLKYTLKSDEPDFGDSEQYGSTYFLKEKDGIRAIRLENGSVIGNYEYSKGFRYGIKADGKYFYLLSEKKVVSYSVGQ